MSLKKMFLLLSLCFLSVVITAQTAISLNGAWKGRILQKDGAFKSEYEIEIYFHQYEDKIVGRSYIETAGIFAEIAFEGEIQSAEKINFQETEIIREEKEEDMEWCIKRVFLSYTIIDGTARLQGTWNGETSYSTCSPGTIILEKVEMRP